MAFWLRGHVRNSKYLYLHFRNTYGHQTWQGGNLPSEEPTYLVRWPFDDMVTWQIFILKFSIFSFAIRMAARLGRAATCSGRTLPLKSRELLIAWSHDKWKKLIATLTQYPGHQIEESSNLIPSTTSRNLLRSWSREKG